MTMWKTWNHYSEWRESKQGGKPKYYRVKTVFERVEDGYVSEKFVEYADNVYDIIKADINE